MFEILTLFFTVDSILDKNALESVLVKNTQKRNLEASGHILLCNANPNI